MDANISGILVAMINALAIVMAALLGRKNR